jgi:anti-sigma factor RsiW
MGCLNDSTIRRFISGQLEDAVRADVENEIGSCRACAALVGELLRVADAAAVLPRMLDTRIRPIFHSC